MSIASSCIPRTGCGRLNDCLVVDSYIITRIKRSHVTLHFNSNLLPVELVWTKPFLPLSSKDTISMTQAHLSPNLCGLFIPHNCKTPSQIPYSNTDNSFTPNRNPNRSLPPALEKIARYPTQDETAYERPEEFLSAVCLNIRDSFRI